MVTVGTFCVVLIVLTTLIHYEVLRALTVILPVFIIPARSKLLVVIFGAFIAHAAEIILYAVAIHVIVHNVGVGTLHDSTNPALSTCLYFSAETYTSLGYGDFLPGGELRLIAGVEALNGLLLIGWSASYTYIAMERFWSSDSIESAPVATQRSVSVDAPPPSSS
jgi:ion channel